MKKGLLTAFIVCCFFGFAQQKQFEIHWDGTKIMSTSSTQLEVPNFDKEHFSFSEDKGLIFYAQWPISVLVNERSLNLSNISYSAISSAELKDLPLHLVTSGPNAKLMNAIDRDRKSAYLELSPIIKENGVFKKITSFSITYSNRSQTASNNFARNGEELTNSVLNSGSWHKFYVDKSGVFKLTKGFLNQIGVNTNVDPRTIKIFGNGGAMLPLINEDFYPLDLTENAVKFVGEQDGVFNDNDFMLFYAEGPREYSEESNTNINLYTDRSYYYVQVSGGFGKRIPNMNQPSAPANLQINTFRDYKYYEVDEFNIAKLGRRWFGDRFDVENQRTYTFSFPNLVTTETARIRVLAGAINEGTTTANMTVNLNGEVVNTMSFPASGANSNNIGSSSQYSNNVLLTSPEVVVTLTYDNAGNPSSIGYLDFISVEATRDLRFEGTQFRFKNDDVITADGVVEYTLTNASNVQEVWDISDKYNVTTAVNQDQSASFNFKAFAGSAKKYLAVTSVNYFEPLRDGNTSVSNQNIKGTIFQNSQGEFEDIDYLIITPTILRSSAERLAQINRDQNQLNVKVVSLDNIYTEFSSGNQDIAAIRNLVKYVYDNASSPENRVEVPLSLWRYVL